MQMASV